jgi:ABC-type polysaccharide/polyol phosphate export permease
MSNNSRSSSSGIGFFGLLGAIFITLKLCGVIGWSWWYVLMPLYLPLCITLVVLAGILAATVGTIGFGALIASHVSKKFDE